MKAVFPIALCGLLVGLAGCEKPEQKPKMPPPEVVVSEVTQEAVPIIMHMAGTVQPVKTVKIVPRVSGYIFERSFTEGNNVAEGDPLYSIDPRPYPSKLDSLKARLEQNQANLQFWTDEAARYDRLAKKGNVSQEDKEKTELTTVVQIEPIYVVSNISREQMYRVQQLQQQGLAPTAADKFTAQLVMPDNRIYSHPGTFNYISALIDPSTDTTQVRFEFPNPKKGERVIAEGLQKVRPGMTVKVKANDPAVDKPAS